MFKKFTNVSGAKVGSDLKPIVVTNEELELNDFKHSIFKLMDDFLSIRSFGSARPELMMPTKIVGKEMFVEALTDFINQKSNKNVVKTLESLKSTNRDWTSIDDKINELESNDNNFIEVNKINNIIDKWGSDEDSLKLFMTENSKKISDKNDLFYKYKICELMFEKNKTKALEIILNSYKERLSNI